MSSKRHINEFMKTGLANSGRAAGMGMSYDRYDDESGGHNYANDTRIACYPPGYSTDPDRMDGPVITYKMVDGVLIRKE